AYHKMRVSRADTLQKSGITAEENLPKPDSMVLVMGTTGAGKSHLVNTMMGYDAVEVSERLEPCKNCRIICSRFGGCNTALIDTPGFDDAYRPDADILLEIAQCLTAQFKSGVRMKGIVYVHRITDIRFQQSDVKVLKILELICGPQTFSNVILATNMWHEIDTFKGQQRTQELRRSFWAPLIQKGAIVHRFDGTTTSARHIFGQLLGKRDVMLQIHRELIIEEKILGETQVGKFL
ncbi:P-loop containing nucleoside triphosphate hydrolase protein, partial [Pyronema omphalodes]